MCTNIESHSEQIRVALYRVYVPKRILGRGTTSKFPHAELQADVAPPAVDRHFLYTVLHGRLRKQKHERHEVLWDSAGPLIMSLRTTACSDHA